MRHGWDATRARCWQPTVLLCLGLASTGCEDDAGPIVHSCPAYTGMAGQGTSWQWEPSPSFAGEGWSGTSTQTIIAISDYDDYRRIDVTRESDLERSGTTYHTEASATYLCSEAGLSLFTYEERTDPTGPGTGTTFYQVIYDPAVLLVPDDLQDGSSWSSEMELTVSHTTQSPTPEDATWTHTAVAGQQDTPAGPFDVISVETDTGTSSWHEHWAATEGLVATDDMVLTAYTAK